jgi:hypothetical protein
MPDAAPDGAWLEAIALAGCGLHAGATDRETGLELGRVLGEEDAFDADSSSPGQLRAQQRALHRLAAQPALRAAALELLERASPASLGLGEPILAALPATDSPEIAAIAGGRWALSDVLAPALRWLEVPSPLSSEQRSFLRSRSPLACQRCPVGGEDLGFLPEVNDRVRYADQLGRPVDPPTFTAGMTAAPRGGLRSRMLRDAEPVLVRAADVTAECTNGHRWAVFETDASAEPP